jgi:hypothetical protein
VSCDEYFNTETRGKKQKNKRTKICYFANFRILLPKIIHLNKKSNMKRFTFVWALIALFFIGCKNNNSNNPFSGSASGQQEANEVIEYYNNALELYKTYNNSYINQGVNYIEKAQEFVEKKATGALAIKPIKPIFMMISPMKENKEAPKGFGDKQETIKKAMEEMKRSAQAMRNLIDATTSYLDAEDYKDDNGKKLKDHQKEAEAQALAFRENAKTLLNTMSPIVNQAEESSLEDHPLKEHIISSKKLVAQTEEFIDEVETQAESERLDDAKLQNLYTAIEEQVAKNEKLEISNKEYASRKSSFDFFNKSVREYLGAARKLIRNAKEAKEFSERDYQELNSNYNQLINAYNNFVD